MSQPDRYKTIEDFALWLARGLSRPTAKFVRDMLSGIHTSQSVRLADIARALGESSDLHSTRNRLSRNLADTQLTMEISDQLLRQGAHSVKRDTRLIVRVHGLIKPNATKMQYLQPSSPMDSYRVCEIVASNTGSQTYLPLLSTFWSRHAPDYISDADKIVHAIRRVLTATNGRGVVFLDYAFAELPELNEIVAELSKDPDVQFVARIPDNVNLRYRQQNQTVTELGALCNTRYAARIFKVIPQRNDETATSQEDYEELYHEIVSSSDDDLAELSIRMEFGGLAVRHPETLRRLSLIVLKGQLSTYLLSSLDDARTRKSLLEPIWSWFSTWEVLSAHWSIRNQYAPNDIGVMTYNRLQLLHTLLHAVVFFESRSYRLKDYSLTRLQPHEGRRFHRDFLLPEDMARMESQ